MSQVTEDSPETGTPWRLGMSAEFHFIIFFLSKIFLKGQSRKMTELNSSSLCGFKATQSKPFPGLLSLWCIYSVILQAWKTRLRARLGYPESPLFPSGVPQWLLLKQPGKDRRSKPLPSLPGWCVSSRTCLYGCSSVPENLSQLPWSTFNLYSRHKSEA